MVFLGSWKYRMADVDLVFPGYSQRKGAENYYKEGKCHSIPTTRKDLVYMFYWSIYYMQLLRWNLLEFHECVRKCKEFGQWVFVGKVLNPSFLRISKKLINSPKDHKLELKFGLFNKMTYSMLKTITSKPTRLSESSGELKKYISIHYYM